MNTANWVAFQNGKAVAVGSRRLIRALFGRAHESDRIVAVRRKGTRHEVIDPRANEMLSAAAARLALSGLRALP